MVSDILNQVRIVRHIGAIQRRHCRYLVDCYLQRLCGLDDAVLRLQVEVRRELRKFDRYSAQPCYIVLRILESHERVYFGEQLLGAADDTEITVGAGEIVVDERS